jgi:hypothetical protein
VANVYAWLGRLWMVKRYSKARCMPVMCADVYDICMRSSDVCDTRIMEQVNLELGPEALCSMLDDARTALLQAGPYESSVAGNLD